MLVHKGGKIKNWGGECRDVTPKIAVSKYQGRCEQRSDVFVKIQKNKKFFLGGGGGGGQVGGMFGKGGGSQGGCEQRIEVFVKIQKKKKFFFFFGGGGGTGSGWGGGSGWM